MQDYEQLYYDMLYENKKLKTEIEILKNEIDTLNYCRTERNINLQKYLILSFERWKNEN